MGGWQEYGSFKMNGQLFMPFHKHINSGGSCGRRLVGYPLSLAGWWVLAAVFRAAKRHFKYSHHPPFGIIIITTPFASFGGSGRSTSRWAATHFIAKLWILCSILTEVWEVCECVKPTNHTLRGLKVTWRPGFRKSV